MPARASGRPQSCPRRRASSQMIAMIVASLAGRLERLAHALHAPLAVGHRPLGLAPACADAGSTTSASSAGLRQEDVLHDEEVEPLQAARGVAAGRPRTAPGSRRSRTACVSSPRSIASNICAEVPAALRSGARRPRRARTSRATRVVLARPGSRAACSGIAPMSPPPCTLFCPRSGLRPEPYRPTCPVRAARD